MIELEDCGREIHLQSCHTWEDDMNVTVQMVIKAARGTLALFDQGYIMTNAQCRAIKAFMEEHCYDQDLC